MSMKVSVSSSFCRGASRIAFAFSSEKKPALDIEREYSGHLPALAKRHFSGGLGETACVNGIIFTGLGKLGDFSPRYVRRALTSGISAAKAQQLDKVDIDCTSLDLHSARNAAYSAGMLSFEFTRFKSGGKREGVRQELSIVASKGHLGAVRDALECSKSINYVREICNTPGNIATPLFMENEVRKVAKAHRLQFKVLDEKGMRKERLNALLSVGQGSAHPPKMPIIEYRVRGARKTVLVVGKGITFDSGGISLKPSKGMEEMKFDKSGACAVLGIMCEVGRIRPKANVIGVIPCAENMPSGSASRPGDIVKAFNGKTVEIINTDAEGRLILADAIAYAEKKYRPDYIIDLATLTGAASVALGSYASALLSNDDGLAGLMLEASGSSFDEVWQLPLWDEYSEMMKSKVADVKNVSGTGEAGTITGAAFIQNFVSKAKWAHLDIASTAYRAKPIPPVDSGATGAGVSITVEFIRKIAAL